MKKLIVLSLIMAGIVLIADLSTPAHAQTPASDLKPTFISPTPGLYVNGWPPFTVSYPKEWWRCLSSDRDLLLPPGHPDRIYPRVTIYPHSTLVTVPTHPP